MSREFADVARGADRLDTEGTGLVATAAARSPSMSATTTSAPARANASAAPRPMPLPAPVTTAARPLRSCIGAHRPPW